MRADLQVPTGLQNPAAAPTMRPGNGTTGKDQHVDWAMTARDRWTIGRLASRVEQGERLEDILGGRPALVVRHGSEVESTRIDTPQEGSVRLQRKALSDTALRSADEGAETQVSLLASPLGELAFAANRVASLLKSDRNPFAGLITVGRARNNDVCLAAGGVSKIHCFLHPTPDGWLIEDNGSTNGTAVNGTTLTPKVRVPLRPGSEVDFGGVLTVFLDADGLGVLLGMVDRVTSE